jgi:hypothetical protein
MNVRLVSLQRHQTHIHATLGAELVRLAAAGGVDIEAGRVVVRNAAATGDPQLDATLAGLAGTSRPPEADRWVGHPRRKILDSGYGRSGSCRSRRTRSRTRRPTAGRPRRCRSTSTA